MNFTDEMPDLSCKKELAELDEKYEQVKKELQSAQDSNATSEVIVALLRDLSRLRGEMRILESAEVDRIVAQYTKKEPVSS
jgi:ribosome-interacting GTPase 1